MYTFYYHCLIKLLWWVGYVPARYLSAISELQFSPPQPTPAQVFTNRDFKVDLECVEQKKIFGRWKRTGMHVFSFRLYVSKTWGHILTVKLNWLMDVLLVLPWWVCYHFFMSVTDWGPTIRFRRQTLVKPPFRSWAEKHGIAWPFLYEKCLLAENSVTMLVDRRRRVRLRVLVVLRDIFLGVL